MRWAGVLFVANFKTIIMNNNNSRVDNKNADVNHQFHPRQEGQQNNTPPSHHADGQRRSGNQGQQMSNMMQDSDEQKAGRENSKQQENTIEGEGDE
jgi:hypothetical protein